MPVMGETGADAGIRVPRYQTTLDRAGLALATGGVLYGALAMLLAARGGEAGVLTLIAVLVVGAVLAMLAITATRSEEHTSELQSLMRISYAVFCLKKKKP